MAIQEDVVNDVRPNDGSLDAIAELLPLLEYPADELDAEWGSPDRHAALLGKVAALGRARQAGDPSAFFAQQFLLSRLYALHLTLPGAPNAEGSVVAHALTRQLEHDTMAAEDAAVDPALYRAEPADADAYVRWIKDVARIHPAFKHDYYHRFLRDQASAADLRTYIIQESAVDARFDDLLALMQVGSTGDAKLEIGANFWDELGNGRPEEVHTTLFGRVLDEFGVTEAELTKGLSAHALLSGNLAVLTCRYRHLYGEAVGYLAMTEWLVPDRFSQVLHAWRRLKLPPVAIVYHELHIGIDARHASGWFANVVRPAAADPRMRRAMTRGALWRLNSSVRYLDHNLETVRQNREAAT
jgi:hypothetical protein